MRILVKRWYKVLKENNKGKYWYFCYFFGNSEITLKIRIFYSTQIREIGVNKRGSCIENKKRKINKSNISKIYKPL
jgi:hypothetical protein